MTRQTYRTIVALWGLLWLAVAAGIGLYVFESWWMAGLGTATALALMWAVMAAKTVRPLASAELQDKRWIVDSANTEDPTSTLYDPA